MQSEKSPEELKANEFRHWYDTELKTRRDWLDKRAHKTPKQAAQYHEAVKHGESKKEPHNNYHSQQRQLQKNVLDGTRRQSG